MARLLKPTTTALGEAVRAKRAGSQHAAADDAGVRRETLSRIERGAHQPSIGTALALARWLGWSVEQVIEAARTPATPPPSEAT